MFEIIMFVSFLFMFLRIYGIKHAAFQAAAHLFVGILIGIDFSSKTSKRKLDDYGSLALFFAILLSIVELVCFLLLR